MIARLEPQNELNALRAAQASAVGRAGPPDRGSQPLRPPGSAAARRLDDAGQSRPSGAALCARPKRRWMQPRRNSRRRTTCQLHRAQGGRAGGHHRGGAEPQERSSRSVSRLHAWPARTAATRCSTCPPLISAAPADPRDHGHPDQRSRRHRQGPRSRGGPAGQCRHAHLRGQGRTDRSAGGDAARRDRDRAPRPGGGAVPRGPGSALTEANGQPAVWVVDPDASTVSMRNVDVLRFDQSSVSVSGGLDIGEVVVTAGVQALHPGQKVRILGSEP